METRLLTYSPLSIPSTTPAHGQPRIVTRSNLISPLPTSIQNLPTSDVADGPGTLARPGGCIEPASNLSLAFVSRERSCSSPPAFPSTGLASKSCFNSPPRATKSRSRTRAASVAGSPVRSSTARRCPEIKYESLWHKTARPIAFGLSSDDTPSAPRCLDRRSHHAAGEGKFPASRELTGNFADLSTLETSQKRYSD